MKLFKKHYEKFIFIILLLLFVALFAAKVEIYMKHSGVELQIVQCS